MANTVATGVKTRSQSANNKDFNMAENNDLQVSEMAIKNNTGTGDNDAFDNQTDEHPIDIQYPIGDEQEQQEIREGQTPLNTLNRDLEMAGPHVKGKVAGMVDCFNNSPAPSPIAPTRVKNKTKRPAVPSSKDTKTRTLFSKNGVLAMESMNERDQHDEEASHFDARDKPSDELISLLRTLNTTVKKLENKLDNMEKEKKQVSERIDKVELVQSQETQQLRGLIEKIDDHDDKIEALIGIVVRQDIEIQELKKKQNAAYVQNTANNIIISGIPLTQNENCFAEAAHFFKTKLKIDKRIPMKAAKRMGRGEGRPMMVTLTDINDKAVIFQKLNNLKAINKGRQNPYFVTDQLPEAWAERRRVIHFMKQQNKKLPDAQQLKMAVKRGELMINNKSYDPPLQPPSVSDLMSLSSERRRVIRQLKLLESESEEKDDSIFVGYTAQAFSLREVENYYLNIRLAEPEATHIMCAFQLPGDDFSQSQGFFDDGEHGGGRVLMQALLKLDVYNQVVFVTRHYGGKHLGPTRFQMIERCANQALEKLQIQIRRNCQPPTQQELDEFIQQQRKEQAAQRQSMMDTAPWTIDNNDEITNTGWTEDEDTVSQTSQD